jgi:hypothetical protein
MGLQQTYYSNASTRADFNKSDFETLIQQKGRRVLLEKAIQCGCKDKQGNQQSNCKNCNGAGWYFINPKETRMILQGMNVNLEYMPNGELIKGDLKVSASNTEELSFMDRLTMLDGEAIFNEVLFFKTKGLGINTITFAFTSYTIGEILYAGYFTGTNSKYQILTKDIDFTVARNTIKIINPAIVPVDGQISVTVRYKHAPAYHMIDMKRESMESSQFNGKENLIHLPISGTARRAHYIIDGNNLNGDKILDNSII